MATGVLAVDVRAAQQAREPRRARARRLDGAEKHALSRVAARSRAVVGAGAGHATVEEHRRRRRKQQQAQQQRQQLLLMPPFLEVPVRAGRQS